MQPRTTSSWQHQALHDIRQTSHSAQFVRGGMLLLTTRKPIKGMYFYALVNALTHKPLIIGRMSAPDEVAAMEVAT